MRIFPIVMLLLLLSCSAEKEKPLKQIVKENLELAVLQYKELDAAVKDSLLPFSEKPDGSINASPSPWWTSGFFPGTLWQLYHYSGDEGLKRIAQKRLLAIENEKFNDGDHDIGFKILCSFGNAWNITKNPVYKDVIKTAAETAIHRFNENVGLIRSWGSQDDSDAYLVIVDNMMNLELLFWATAHTGDSSFFKIAVHHADNTLKNHYRSDGSSFHVLNYDQESGEVLSKKTAQGYSDASAWARGNAWGFYGFVMAYRETGFQRYLDHAQKIAAFLINHPNMPDDGVPYWDFNAPDIPQANRDASAGAIIASACIELSDLVTDSKKSQSYLSFAKNTLRTLSSPEYRTRLGEHNNYLLKHGVGHMPAQTEIDVPLIYADYYYVEALLRLKEKL